MTTESTTAISRGRYLKTQDGAAPKREKRIPEYLEADEINAIIRTAPQLRKAPADDRDPYQLSVVRARGDGSLVV